MIPKSEASRATRVLRASRRQLEHSAEPNEEVEASEFGHLEHVFDFDKAIEPDGSSTPPLPAPFVLLPPQPPTPLQHEEGLGLVMRRDREKERGGAFSSYY